MKPRLFLRKKFLIGRSTQLKYLALLVISMVAPLLVVGSCLYYLIFTLLADQLGIPEYIAYNLFPVVKKINIMLLIGIPPLFLLLILCGVLLSHRFVGPMERLARELDRLSKDADYSKRIRLRRYDDMKPIADAINRMLDKIEGKAK